jgi:hypothetical protein
MEGTRTLFCTFSVPGLGPFVFCAMFTPLHWLLFKCRSIYKSITITNQNTHFMGRGAPAPRPPWGSGGAFISFILPNIEQGKKWFAWQWLKTTGTSGSDSSALAIARKIAKKFFPLLGGFPA